MSGVVGERPAAVGYTEVLAGGDHRVARSVVGIVVLTLVGYLLAPILLLPVLYAALRLERGSSADPTVASDLLHANLATALLIPLAWLLVRYLHGVRPRWLASVAPGVRWRLLLVCLGLSAVSVLLTLVVSTGLPVGAAPAVSPGDGAPAPSSAALVLVVVLLTTPLQAIGEEYGFRGYLLQAVGALSGRPWVAVGVTALVFALAHGEQNPPLFLDRLAFGVTAGATVVLLGGLEAAIAMHVVNNVFGFVLALATGMLMESLTLTATSWWAIVTTLVQQGSYLLLVLIAARELGVRRTTPRDAITAPKETA